MEEWPTDSLQHIDHVSADRRMWIDYGLPLPPPHRYVLTPATSAASVQVQPILAASQAPAAPLADLPELAEDLATLADQAARAQVPPDTADRRAPAAPTADLPELRQDLAALADQAGLSDDFVLYLRARRILCAGVLAKMASTEQ